MSDFRSLSRREFLRVAGIAAVGSALAACSSLQAQPSTVSEQIQLAYQDSRVGWFSPMVQQMLEQFHAKYPNIRVFYTPELENPQDIEEKTLRGMQLGMAPDVFQGCCDWFPIWAQKGYTLDLRPYVAADLDRATIDDFSPSQFKYFFTRDGRQYALPKYHGGLALYYNRDLFDEYKVVYPDASWNHDDYLAAMKRLTHDRDHDGKIDLWGSMTYVSWARIQIHVNGWGGHMMDPNDPTKCRMDEPEALAALEWLRARMWDDKVMATPLDVQRAWPNDAFIAGKLAMVEDGSWQLKGILTNAKFRVGVAPFPAGPVKKVTLATTDGFAIYSGTKHPDAAWKLLQFLISKDYGRAMARANFLQPARASLLDEWMGFIRAEFPEQTKDLDVLAFADGQLKGYAVTAEDAANQAEATRIANEAWDQILTLGKAPVDLMKATAREIEASQS